MYFSLVPNPGYDISFLNSLGIDGEFRLFHGNFSNENNATGGSWNWGTANHSIESKLVSLLL